MAERVAALVIAKQADYGHDNILGTGEVGLVVRVNDKIARLRNLVLNKKTPMNETVRDTWVDVAGYAIIALMLADGTFTRELGEA